MDHKKYEQDMRNGVKTSQFEKGDNKEKHNDRGSSGFSGSHQTKELHNSNDNPRIKRSLDTHEDYAKDLQLSATNSDKNLHGDSSNTRSKRSTATTTHGRTKGQGQNKNSDQGSSTNQRNNMQRQQSTDGTIMDMMPRDGSTSGVSYKDMP